MKKTLSLLAAALMVPFFASAEEAAVRTEGAQVGEWTQDWDAAVALSKEKDVPVFALFTGSDWCPYCVKLHDRIFAKAGWADWAKDNLVLVYLDFPRDASRVPVKYRERNQELTGKYGIEGYPTCVLLSVDELETMATFGYDDSDTPESFAKDVEGMLPLAKRDGLKKLLNEKEWSQYQEAKAKAAKAKAVFDEAGAKIQAKGEALEKEGKSRDEIIKTLQGDIKELEPTMNALQAAQKVIGALTKRAQKRSASGNLMVE